MKVLAVVPAILDTSPGQRFRIEQWEAGLAAKGIEITYAPFESAELNRVIYQNGQTAKKARLVISSYLKRLSSLLDIKKFDLVYVFREAALIGPAFFERLLSFRGVPFVFDYDDAIFLSNSSKANAKFEILKYPKKTETICQLASWVMPGNQFLADYALRFNKNVTVIPTTIDTDKYLPVSTPNRSKKVTVGWSGSRTTVANLNTLRETIAKLAKKEEFLFRVIGTDDYAIDGVDLKSSLWDGETEVEDLCEIDIGIMPLPDDDWSRGKCALKALQYMALGVPTICSRVGANIDVIEDGVNGFLASDESEWIEKLTILINRPELRRELGLKGKTTVLERYSAISQAPRVAEVFHNAVNISKVSKDSSQD